MRKFYDIVEVREDGHGYTIHLDGKPVKTPQKTLLTIGGKALADAIADEWRAQQSFIVPATMPLMQYASTALDRIAPNKQDTIEGLLEYAKTDLVCYRADKPDELTETQSALFDPLLEWFEERTGHALIVARGLMPIVQPPQTIQAVQALLSGKSAELLTAIQIGAGLASSLLIPLALSEGEISAEDAFRATCSEELYQMEKWGEDDEARERLRDLQVEFQMLQKYIALQAQPNI